MSGASTLGTRMHRPGKLWSKLRAFRHNLLNPISLTWKVVSGSRERKKNVRDIPVWRRLRFIRDWGRVRTASWTRSRS
jgi:hypothetical protein